ncbi:MAG: DUF554 domain-containing protein [Fimbriimonadaceae bacterium]|nr:DUF554 domain-containing protein [Fimbriimonadaceae bacterium]
MGARHLPVHGTLVNTASVAAGASLGLVAKSWLDPRLESVVVFGVGLCVMALGAKLFIKGSNVVLTVASVAVGGVLGVLAHVEQGFALVAEQARVFFGGQGTFSEGLITSSVLFCVGPMTLLGCLKDALEGDSELLIVKSWLDGITSVFLAAALGPGVLVSALVVLVAQGGVSLLARYLKPLADSPGVLDEVAAVGGVIVLAIGLGLTGIKKFPVETFLPALLVVPAWSAVAARFAKQGALQAR